MAKAQAREARSVVAPGMLQNPSVKSWLGGVEPAWTLLDQASFTTQYRAKWGLPADYPMVAPRYLEGRSKAAMRIGLGTKAQRESVGR